MKVRKALEPFKDLTLGEDPEPAYADEAFVNVTAPRGRVSLHRDNEPWSLVFVSLTAKVKARIKHRDESDYSEAILVPGDAVKVINPPAKKQRPKHEFINLSDSVRVSYGEYTTQQSE